VRGQKKMIKAIFLDLHGVISNEWHILRNYWLPAYTEYLSYEQIREKYHKAKIQEITFDKLFHEVPKEKHFSYANKIKLHKGAKEALEELSKKYLLYLASDQIEGAFEKEIETLKIKNYFKKIFVSYKLGLHKPNKDFFEKILLESKEKANESIFVDDAKNNLETAKKLGFTTVWVNNHAESHRNQIDYKPDYEIEDLKELIQIAKELEKKK
jgi:HAD superfamily hydrolase (TIGR01509 family)